MRVLVAGGAGFIGSRFAEKCLGRGYNVTVLDNFSNPTVDPESLKNTGCKVISADIRNLSEELLPADFDIVVNFAAETHNDDSLRRPLDFAHTNIIGTLNLLQFARRIGARFHQISTDEVFGDTETESNKEFDSTSCYNPSSPYSASKASSDLMVMAWSRSFAVPATISYCTNNFGPRQSFEKLIPRTVLKIGRSSRPILYGDGSNRRDWLFVDDHVDGLLLVLEKGTPGGRYFFSSGVQTSNAKLVDRILAIMGSNLRPEFVEDRPGHDRRYALNSTLTRKELGWAPSRSFESALADTVRGLAARGDQNTFVDDEPHSKGKSK